MHLSVKLSVSRRKDKAALLCKRRQRAKDSICSPLPYEVLFLFFSTPFFVLPALISCNRAPWDERAATQKSPGTGRQVRIRGDGSVYARWQVCPFRADGGVCQEVFRLGAEPKGSSGVDSCEGGAFNEAAFAHELFVCQRLSGYESQACVCVCARFTTF